MAVTIRGSGQVPVQVVQAIYSTSATNSTTTYADTGLTATITPTNSANKILVLVHQSECGNSNGNIGIKIQLLRGATSIQVLGAAIGYGGANLNASISTAYLDSPATTSAVTYKTQFALNSATGSCAVQNDSATSTITLLEISGT